MLCEADHCPKIMVKTIPLFLHMPAHIQCEWTLQKLQLLAAVPSTSYYKWSVWQPLGQSRTGPLLVAGLPCYKVKSGRLLAGLPPADVCQSTTDSCKVLEVPRHGLWLCRVSSSRPARCHTLPLRARMQNLLCHDIDIRF